MPRILHLIPTLAGGGAERQLAMLATEQAKCGWDVHVGIRRGGIHFDFLRCSGVTIHEIGDFKSIDPRLIFHVNKLIKAINTDVVQTWLPQMDVVGGIASLASRVKWIGTERSSSLGIKDDKLLTLLRNIFFRYAYAVVANSASGEYFWRSVLPKRVRIFRISNAVDVKSIENAPPADIEDSLREGRLILVVGRLHYLKAVDVSIKAFAMMPGDADIKLLIIGEGPMREELKELIAKLRLENRVWMSPYRPDWWGVMKHASALISMSRCEGNPNVVLEAMAADCPLIVSDIPEHREILDTRSTLFAPVDSPVELGSLISKLLSDSSATLGRAHLAKVRVNRMSVDTVAKAYESIYTHIDLAREV